MSMDTSRPTSRRSRSITSMGPPETENRRRLRRSWRRLPVHRNCRRHREQSPAILLPPGLDRGDAVFRETLTAANRRWLNTAEARRGGGHAIVPGRTRSDPAAAGGAASGASSAPVFLCDWRQSRGRRASLRLRCRSLDVALAGPWRRRLPHREVDDVDVDAVGWSHRGARTAAATAARSAARRPAGRAAAAPCRHDATVPKPCCRPSPTASTSSPQVLVTRCRRRRGRRPLALNCHPLTPPRSKSGIRRPARWLRRGALFAVRP